nr:MAG TPA: adenine-specific methyltransferase [Caudoviricetes sp.]
MINKIFNESCLNTLARMSDDSVDLVITSPPYNMNLRIRDGKYCSRQITKEFSTKYDGFSDNMPIAEYFDFHLRVIKELLRVAPIVFYNVQIVTGSKRAVFKLLGELNEYVKDIIVWDKENAQPAMSEGVLNRQYELMIVFAKRDAISRKFNYCNFERGTLNDVWRIKRGKKVTNLHGATFPEELVEKILTNFSRERDVVYDPFMGTGTTAVVCKKMNRRFIGSEIITSYVEVAKERLQND